MRARHAALPHRCVLSYCTTVSGGCRMMAAFLTRSSPGVFLISVQAKPGARASSVVAPLRMTDDALQVRIAAPPVEGKANAELVDFLQSSLEDQVRALSAVMTHTTSSSSSNSSANSAAADAFFAGTSYADLLKQSVTESSSPNKTGATPEDGDTPKKAKKGKGGSHQASRSSPSSSPCTESTALSLVSRLAARQPCSVSAELARGSTSKSKCVAVQFPGSEAELVGMLQRVAQE